TSTRAYELSKFFFQLPGFAFSKKSRVLFPLDLARVLLINKVIQLSILHPLPVRRRRLQAAVFQHISRIHVVNFLFASVASEVFLVVIFHLPTRKAHLINPTLCGREQREVRAERGSDSRA